MDWTLQQIAERIIDEPFRAKGEDVRERQIAMILTWLETVQRQERRRSARIAALFTMGPDAQIHPDIKWADMNESARIAAHTTAQQIAIEILEGFSIRKSLTP